MRNINQNINWSDYIESVKNGASFVTNGPMIEFKLNKTIEHGDIVKSGQQFTLRCFQGAVDKVEIIINGTSVKEFAGIKKGENKTFSGLLDIPVVAGLQQELLAERQCGHQWTVTLCTYISNLDKFCW